MSGVLAGVALAIAGVLLATGSGITWLNWTIVGVALATWVLEALRYRS